jgi:hypothetical protein
MKTWESIGLIIKVVTIPCLVKRETLRVRRIRCLTSIILKRQEPRWVDLKGRIKILIGRGESQRNVSNSEIALSLGYGGKLSLLVIIGLVKNAVGEVLGFIHIISRL